MKQIQNPVTFEIRIDGYKNHTWQGEVIMEDGQAVEFQSDLELLKIIGRWMREDVEMLCCWENPV